MKWYSASATAYITLLMVRLQKELKARPSNPAPASSCFKLLQEEVRVLTSHLFGMPEIQGGVPIAFLEASGAEYECEKDGFEVLKP